jgi:hypothetical protein
MREGPVDRVGAVVGGEVGWGGEECQTTNMFEIFTRNHL